MKTTIIKIISLIVMFALSLMREIVSLYEYKTIPRIIKSTYTSFILIAINISCSYYLMINIKNHNTTLYIALIVLAINNIIGIISYKNLKIFHTINVIQINKNSNFSIRYHHLYSPIIQLFQSIYYKNNSLFISSLFEMTNTISIIIMFGNITNFF